jgi:pyruvate dehydrogenase E2 component (dihydrolipoamide acetyltransferase)
MPALGADMESGVLAEWLIGPGDRVARGDIVAVVETDKGAIEIEAYEEGLVQELLEPVGATVPVGRPLARLGEPSAPGPVPPPPAEPAPVAPAPPPPAVRASPAARRAAAEHGVALAGVVGTGPDGSITLADVERAAAAPAAAAGPSRAAGPDRSEALRRAIGDLMARSKREIPHYYLDHRVDAGAALAWVEAANEGRPPAARLVLTPLLLRAVALGAREVPEMNGHWRDGRFVPADAVNVGLAISLREGGVVAPAIHDVDRKGVEELMEEVRALVARVRSGVMRSSEIADATITLSSLGDRSAEGIHGIIFPPQVALVGAGSPLVRPWVSDGRVEARPVVALSLAADHRVSDGRRGGRFLARIERLLQAPEEL